MPTTFGTRGFSWNPFLKLFNHYINFFALTFFKVSHNGRLRSSRKVQFICVSWRLLCVAFFCFNFQLEEANLILGMKRKFIHAMAALQFTSLFGTFVVCFSLQVVKQKQFIDIINRATAIVHQIFKIKNDFSIIGNWFYFIILFRILCNASVVFAELLRLSDEDEEISFLHIGILFLSLYLCFGTLVVVDLICLGYLVAGNMYQYVGDQLTLLAKRIETLDHRSMTKFCQMQMLCDFSDELDNYASLYSDIFQLLKEFHHLLQLYMFFQFCSFFLIVIGNIHHTFLIYLEVGTIRWSLLFVSGFQAIQIVFFMLLLHRTVKASRIPNSLNLDVILSDVEPRWDRSVDQFLNQLKFQELNLNVYGLFELNNELLLHGFKATASYLTILIQFKMLGFFK